MRVKACFCGTDYMTKSDSPCTSGREEDHMNCQSCFRRIILQKTHEEVNR